MARVVPGLKLPTLHTQAKQPSSLSLLVFTSIHSSCLCVLIDNYVAALLFHAHSQTHTCTTQLLHTHPSISIHVAFEWRFAASLMLISFLTFGLASTVIKEDASPRGIFPVSAILPLCFAVFESLSFRFVHMQILRMHVKAIWNMKNSCSAVAWLYLGLRRISFSYWVLHVQCGHFCFIYRLACGDACLFL